MDFRDRAFELRESGLSLRKIKNELQNEFERDFKIDEIKEALQQFTLAGNKNEIVYKDKKQFPTIQTVGEFYESLKQYNQAINNLDTKQTNVTIKIKDDKPIGIAFDGDHHLGSLGVDYKRYDEDRVILRNTDGLYSVKTGDYKENQNPFIHAGGVTEQTAQPALQDLLVAENMKKEAGKILAIIRGCHDDWTYKLDNRDFISELAKITNSINLWHGGMINVILGSQSYTIRARHKYQGESNLNTTNAQRRMLDGMGFADVLAIAHKHYPDLQQVNKMGEPVTFIRSGSYKTYDEFGQKIGGYKGEVGVPVVVLFPDKKRVIPFRELEAGVEYLNAVRK